MNLEAAPAMPHIVREPIPRDLAFPVGFEFLRAHFGTVVGTPETVLWFRAHPTPSSSEFAEVLRGAEPYPILRVQR